MQKASLKFPVLIRRISYTARRKYTDYRLEIREDCQCRCVYCNCHEKVLGGSDAMQLDHFHPQSRFPERKHDPTNLLWVCNRCNLLKRDDWHPLDQNGNQKMGYVDPFGVDRNLYFETQPTGELSALNDPAAYMIQRLKLNRDFLIYIRRSRQVIVELQNRVNEHFDEQCEYFEKLLERGAITHEECDSRIEKAQKMKRIILEFIDKFSYI
jgi:hypothetical protein